MAPTRAAQAGGADELREQWDFLDTLVEKQQRRLRVSPDPEEVDDVVPAATVAAVESEVEQLRGLVATLEAERDRLTAEASAARPAADGAALQRRIAVLEAEREALAADREALVRAGEAAREAETLRHRLTEVEEEHRRLVAEVDAAVSQEVARQHQALQDLLAGMEAERERLSADLAAVRRERDVAVEFHGRLVRSVREELEAAATARRDLERALHAAGEEQARRRRRWWRFWG